MKNSFILFMFFLLGSITHLTYAQSENDTSNLIYDFEDVEIKPEYIGGSDAMNNFLFKNIRYPEIAVDNEIQGTVLIELVIEKDGSISNIRVINQPVQVLAREAERVMKLMPKWKPGYQNDTAVRVLFKYPVKFKTHIDEEPLGPSVFGQDSTIKVYNLGDLDIQPSFPDGKDEMFSFIYKQVRYTEAALDNGIEGQVILYVLLDTDGSIKDIQINKDPGYGLGKEAERVVRLMPKWSPGIINGKPVFVKFQIPVNFKMVSKSKNEKRKK
jgi:TonB family protein